MVINYSAYLVRVYTGRSRPPQMVSSTIKGRYSMSSFDSNNSNNIYNSIQKEFKKRLVQCVVDQIDPKKAAERSAQNAEALMLQEQHTPKYSLLGYEAPVCESCLTYLVHPILSYGTPTDTRRVDFPKHVCLEKKLECVKQLTSIERTQKIRALRENAENSLIKFVAGWSKKQKTLVSFPWHSEENSIYLGFIKKGHWAWRVAKPTICGTILTEPELRDFLKKAYSTMGVFTMTLGEGSTLTKKFVLINDDETKPSSKSKNAQKMIGYRGYVCEKCCTSEALETYTDGKQCSERIHKCDPERRLEFELHTNREKELKELRDKLPRRLMTKVTQLAPKEKYLKAVKVGPIKEGCIELGSVNNNHWAARAIKKSTTLDDKELLEFLEKARATYGNFKIRNGRNNDIYFMIILDDPIE